MEFKERTYYWLVTINKTLSFNLPVILLGTAVGMRFGLKKDASYISRIWIFLSLLMQACLHSIRNAHCNALLSHCMFVCKEPGGKKKNKKKVTARYIYRLSGSAGVLLLKKQQHLSVSTSHQSKQRCWADTLIQDIQGQACFVAL